MTAFPAVRVGSPVSYQALSVLPLFTEPNSSARVDYLLSDEALTGSVTVEETSETGSVPHLVVNNQSDIFVLFLEGEVLRGAKQNRVLNTSVLVAGHSKTTIPVSCVERGRWRYMSRQFASGGSHSSSKLRGILKKSVTAAMYAGHGHSSDQGAVWTEVDRQMGVLGAKSPTSAMTDTYEAHGKHLTEFRDYLKYVEGATGLAVAVGGNLVSVDLFDKPTTCEKVWDRLLTGVIMDALETAPTAVQAQDEDVQKLLANFRSVSWQPTPPVGAGEEVRAELDGNKHASALRCGGELVHGSVVVVG